MIEKIYDIVVVGLGPAGIGFINSINNGSNLDIAVIEKGRGMNQRSCKILSNQQCFDCPKDSCQMIHGIGGASLLGGHKISGFPAGTFLNKILQKEESDIEYYNLLLNRLALLFNFKKPLIYPPEIEKGRLFYKSKGYNFKYYDSYLCSINNLKKGYEFLLKNNLEGVDLFLNTNVKNISKVSNIYNIELGEQGTIIKSKKVVIAVGRSGYKLLTKINHDFSLKGKPNHLELGIRLEFPTKIFNDIDRYHNDLKLIRKNVRTFCVSKNGMLSPYYCDDMYIVDGFYNISSPTGFTNLALMLRLENVSFNNEIFDSIKSKMDQKFRLKPIIQDYNNFIQKHSQCNDIFNSSISFLQKGSIFEIYPDEVSDLIVESTIHFVTAFFNKKDHDKINIIAPSIEYYWMDFPINENFSIQDNLYLIGDCTGKYRGILQAFISGAILANKLT